MTTDLSTLSHPHLANRLRQLVCSSPPGSALFFAGLWDHVHRQYDQELAHEALHALALAFLATNQPYSALHIVKPRAETQVSGLRSGRPKVVVVCGSCAFIFSRCCEKVGRYSDGQNTLLKALRANQYPNLPQMSAFEGSGSHLLMLARVAHKAKGMDAAALYYGRALADDPWLWEAFTGLCDIGLPPSEESLFPDPPAKPRPASNPRSPRTGPSMPTLPMPRSSASEDPALALRRRQSPHTAASAPQGFFTPDGAGTSNGAGGAATSRLGVMGNNGGPSASTSTWDTPSFSGGAVADTTFPGVTPTGGNLAMPQTSRRPFPGLMSALSTASSAMLPASLRSSHSQASGGPTAVATPVSAPPDAAGAATAAAAAAAAKPPPALKRPRAHMSRRGDPAPSNAMRSLDIRPRGREMRGIEPNGETPSDGIVRRSTRLKTDPTAKAPRQTQSSQAQTQDQRSVRSRSGTSSSSVTTATGGQTSSAAQADAALQAAADDWLRGIVRKCARAYRFSSMYRCAEAEAEINGLPTEVSDTAWALDIKARALYEMGNYLQANTHFVSLFEREPYRLRSAELYSTTMYLLHDARGLSYLSRTLLSVDRTTSPEAWMACGNVFSHQKEHDEAMRCFKRATQIDPECAYAWTLCGYEASEMDEYERAMGYFRTAIRTDARHYNAWYGMGLVYMRQGKLRHAEHHFRRASEINPTNPVLLCCIGQVLEQLGHAGSALGVYERAIKFADNTPMVMFKYARLLVAQRRIEEAIPKLEALSRTAPQEAQVQFLLGKCYIRMDRRAEATTCFAHARELQPKLEGAIRKVLDVADGDDDDDGESGDDEDEAM